MTNLKPVTEGFNKFCGPAVLSILTGKSTDICANAISRINGQYNIKGVLLVDLLRAGERLGFTSEPVSVIGNSMFSALTRLSHNDGMYIVTLEKHFVCIEVNERKIYFCDNHTKEPIPAASSARLHQKVVAIHKVFKKHEPEIDKPLEPPVQRELKPAEYTVAMWRCVECNSIGGPDRSDVVHYNTCSQRTQDANTTTGV